MRKIPTLFVRDEATHRKFVKNEPHPDCGWVLEGKGWPTRKIDGACCRVRDGRLYKRREVKIHEAGEATNAGVLAIPEAFAQAPVDPDDNSLLERLLEAMSQPVEDPDGPARALPSPLAVLIPSGFEIVNYDAETGKLFGWLPVSDDAPEDARHRDAWNNHRYLTQRFSTDWPPPDGTYELIGPKVNGNPEMVSEHVLVEHGYRPAADQHILDGVPRSFDDLSSWMRNVASDLGWEGIVWHDHDGRLAKLKRKDFPKAVSA